MNVLLRRLPGAIALAILLVLSACDRGVTEPDTQVATVSLVTPGVNDGAVLVTLQGPGFGELRASSSAYRIYWRLENERTVKALVIGNLVAGPLFTAEMSRSGRASYSATLTEVARRDNALQEALTGYSLTIAFP
jgi:hypothetical protein